MNNTHWIIAAVITLHYGLVLIFNLCFTFASLPLSLFSYGSRLAHSSHMSERGVIFISLAEI